MENLKVLTSIDVKEAHLDIKNTNTKGTGVLDWNTSLEPKILSLFDNNNNHNVFILSL